ncbi:AcrR family transcriptional regulator [Variovorax boronicumulans]|uniref:AcrR family transcriptional regulator n=1 Tax=Variovorax boronicumulans TaxID=436515 RepID=A0AAW8DUB5_9BURK|nr:TetR/AcrR family transcriptional regulator [Variovorax boronicumulans]MDP9877649.1 AcrR family transcriptional regulator [Variovorax boronicumulans]MDP9922934.1 AcrR family transcriptional regulator [Variovorax boronicumulans]
MRHVDVKRPPRKDRALSSATVDVEFKPPLQSRSEKSLSKMINAGRELVELSGDFEGMMLSDVIRLAGTSTGAFYGRFRDKDAFVAAILESAFAQIRKEVDSKIDAELLLETGRASEVAASIVHIYVAMCRENRGLFKAVLRHFAINDPSSNPIRALDHHIRSRTVPALIESMRRQSQSVSDPNIQIGIQFVVGTLAITLLTDPGPLRFASDNLEANLQAMLQRFLQLP